MYINDANLYQGWSPRKYLSLNFDLAITLLRLVTKSHCSDWWPITLLRLVTNHIVQTGLVTNHIAEITDLSRHLELSILENSNPDLDKVPRVWSLKFLQSQKKVHEHFSTSINNVLQWYTVTCIYGTLYGSQLHQVTNCFTNKATRNRDCFDVQQHHSIT